MGANDNSASVLNRALKIVQPQIGVGAQNKDALPGEQAGQPAAAAGQGANPVAAQGVAMKAAATDGGGTTAAGNAAAGAAGQGGAQVTMEHRVDEALKADPLTEAERKRAKRQALFAAIGDGISALSNLYFTSKGAPNMFDASKGLSAAHMARWEKLKAERDKHNKEFLSLRLQAAGMDAQQAAEKVRQAFLEKQHKENMALEREKFGWNKQEADRKREDEAKKYQDAQAAAEKDRQFEQEKFEHQKKMDEQSNAIAWRNVKIEERKNGGGTVTFNIKDGKGGYSDVAVDLNSLHDAAVAGLYKYVPDEVKVRHAGSKRVRGVDIPKAADRGAMLRAIGEVLNDDDQKELRNALRRLAGIKDPKAFEH